MHVGVHQSIEIILGTEVLGKVLQPVGYMSLLQVTAPINQQLSELKNVCSNLLAPLVVGLLLVVQDEELLISCNLSSIK